jgi:hypothetical protein
MTFTLAQDACGQDARRLACQSLTGHLSIGADMRAPNSAATNVMGTPAVLGPVTRLRSERHVVRSLACGLLAMLLAGCGTTTVSPAACSPGPIPSSVTATVPASAPAGPSMSPTPAPPPSPVAAVRGRDWEWRDVWTENPLGQSPSLTGVIFTGSGFTAWGPTAGGSGLLTSTGNLEGWSQADTGGLFHGMRIIGLASAPAGIVALGTDKAGLVQAWVSSDGSTWKAGPARTGIDGVVHAIVSSGGGIYYAAGTAKGGCDVAIWVSHDGLTWQPSGPLEGARGTCSTGGVGDSPAITLLRDGVAGLVAYGTVPGIGSAFWTSADRVHWTFRPQPSLGGHVAGLAATGSGYIAVGTVGTGGGVVWRSQDGVTWTQAPDQASLAGVALADVLALDDGSLVAVGSDADHAFVAWTSTDGLAWNRAPEPVPSNSGPLGRPDHEISWRLASDGHASTNPTELLVAVGGGSRAMVSPPVTPGLRAGGMTITLSGLVALPGETVAGSCADSADGSGGTDVHIVLADLAHPNPAEVSVNVGRDGKVTGFSLTSDTAQVAVGSGAPFDPSLLTTAAASTPMAGQATFRDLVSSLAPAASGRLAGTVAWHCSW